MNWSIWKPLLVSVLNFDYGIETEYRQIVVQLKENFLGDAFKETPEFNQIRDLSHSHFDQFIRLLEVFQLLATSNDVKELNDQDTSIKLLMDDKIRMGAI
jgi:hypothetical protein